MKKMQWTDPVTEEVLINSESVLTDIIQTSGGDTIYDANAMDGFDIEDDDMDN